MCYRKKKRSLSGLNNPPSYGSRTSSANRNMLFQGPERKHRQVAFCLYYTVLICFCFTVSWVLLDVKQKHSSGLNSCSNCTHLVFFYSLHSAFSYFWWKYKNNKLQNETALKCHRNLRDEKENLFILDSCPFLTGTTIFKRLRSFYLLT